MKILWILPALFLLPSCCVERSAGNVESYTCTPEQQEQVKQMTKACKEKLTSEMYINDCFGKSVISVCTMKPNRCPAEKDEE